ncbi:MAG: SDR family oxidoreductase [Acidobacteriota bacterium]|jgi:3-oxoacyl-[acyl-carrier protein] reductase
MNDSRRLQGRVAVVTGGGRGIGRAIARLFAHEGAQVTVWELAPPAECWWEESQGRIVMDEVDVASAEGVPQAAARVVARHGRVDVLVNNAGFNIPHQPHLENLAEEELQQLLEVNLQGAVRVTRALLPHLPAGGRIINISSILAAQGFPGQSAYAASKAGLEALTRVWARELGPRGITVNAVAPGFIDTHMNAGLSPDFRRGVVVRTALRRLGTPEDVARVCLFLASADAAFVTGACLPVDGGLRL